MLLYIVKNSSSLYNTLDAFFYPTRRAYHTCRAQKPKAVYTQHPAVEQTFTHLQHRCNTVVHGAQERQGTAMHHLPEGFLLG